MALMGPDGNPRWVRSISKGYGEIVEIVPKKGQPWRCNLDHILTLVRTGETDDANQRKRNRDGEVLEVTVRDWLGWSKYRKHIYKLFRVGVEFPAHVQEALPVEPYLLGLLLGDGSLSRGVTSICSPDPEIIEYCRDAAIAWGLHLSKDSSPDRAPSHTFSQGQSRGAENPLTGALRRLGIHGDRAEMKHIPECYRVAPRLDRLDLLAGLLDTDGHLANGYFDYISASRHLAKDVAFVARSLGLAAYVKQCDKGIASTGFRGTYYRVSISGNTDCIPTRVARKRARPRRQKKDVLRTGFDVIPVGGDSYCGFTLSGDGRYLLGDFTVTHNTELAIHLIQEAEDKGSRVVFVADRIALVDQTSQRLWGYGISHGVAQGSNTYGRRERIQVASAQTIEKREYWNNLDLLVIDEAHIQRKKIMEFAKEWGGPVIGLTATPLTPDLGSFYEHIVNATTTDQLLAEGWLAPLRIYAAAEIDMTGAKKTAGEWTASEVRNRGRRIIGDIVSEWVRMTQTHFGGPVKTLVFSADIAHGEELCRAFQAAGHDFRQSTHKDDDATTRRLVKGFREGAFQGLVSVEKFVRGFDVPDVLCMIGARPYSSSLASVVQQLGRGMRAAPGKEYCLYLDHAGNMAGWYEDVCEIWEKGVDNLPEPKKKREARREGKARQDVVCFCGYVFMPGMAMCPSCGREKKRRTQAETVAGRMEELTRPGSRKWAEDKRWTWRHICRIAADYRGDGTERAKKFALAQYKTLYDEWPEWGWGHEPADGSADARVRRKVLQQLRAYSKNNRGSR